MARDRIDPERHAVVGRGGYSAVYAVSARRVGKLVPVPPERRGDRSLTSSEPNDNPWRELHIHRLADRLPPGDRVVRTASSAFDGESLHIMMERYDGDVGSLLRQPDGGEPPGDLVRSVCLQVLQGYDALWGALGFYHGDAGPSNVLYRRVRRNPRDTLRIGGKDVVFDNAGVRVAISDFGSAVVRDFPMGRAERAYYSRIKDGGLTNAWQFMALLAEGVAPGHPGLARLLLSAALYYRVGGAGGRPAFYVFDRARPGWPADRVVGAVLGWDADRPASPGGPARRR